MNGVVGAKRDSAGLRVRASTLRVGLIAAAAAVAVYVATLRHQFLWDDFAQILDNPWLRDPRSLPTIFSSDSWVIQRPSGHYRPLFHVAYLVLYQAFGPNPVAFHAASVLLHALNTLLVVLVVRRLHRSLGDDPEAGPGLALVAGLVFAVHPLNATVVAWVQGMDNSLSICFGLTALLAHHRGGPVKGGLTAALALTLAAFSRETALIFPPLLLLSDLVIARRPVFDVLRARWPRYGLYATALGGYFALRARAIGGLLSGAGGTGFDARSLFLDGPVLLALNLRLLAIPFPLAAWPQYTPVRSPADPRFLVALSVISLMAFVAVKLAKRSRIGFLGLILILLPLSLVLYPPALGILPIGYHRLYLSSAGLGVLLAVWLFRTRPASSFLRRHRARIGFVVAAALAAGTVVRAPLYADGLSFWGAAVRDAPGRWMPHLHLGLALLEAKRLEEGIAELKKAMAIDPSDPLAHYHLGGAYARQGWRDLAVAEYQAALAVDPAHFPSLSELAQLEMDAGRNREALALLQRAAQLAPGHPWVRDRLGVALFLTGRTEEGIAELKTAAGLAPWDDEIRGHLERAQEWLRNSSGAALR